MDFLDFVPRVSSDGSKITFRLSERIGSGECAITREALEAHFWLSPGADASRMLKTFSDCQNRIAAIAERKMRARPDQPVQLTSDDFVTKR